MPWCPQCDEVFPSGPACPRCRAALVDMADLSPGADPAAGGALPQLKVPRRLRRAFDRMNRPAVPPRQLLTLVLGLLVFLAGMAVGQMGSRPLVVDRPILSIAPLPVPPQTSVEHMVEDRSRGYADLLLLRRQLDAGTSDPARRLNLPPGQVSAAGRATARLRSLSGSVAAIVDSGEQRLVAAIPDGSAPLSWLQAVDAAWDTRDSLLVLEPGGALAQWTFTGPGKHVVPGDWTALHQTSAGAVLESPGGLASATAEGVQEAIGLPPEGSVLAAAPSGRLVLVSVQGHPATWDGVELRPSPLEGYEAIAATFSPSGSQVAVTLVQRPEPGGGRVAALAVLDEHARQVTFERLSTLSPGRTCEAAPVWDPAGSWVYVAPGDRTLYAVQVAGGQRPRARIENAGCGLAWAA